MWNFITQLGVVSTILCFTEEFSLPVVSLTGRVALSGAIPSFATVRYCLSQRAKSISKTVPTSADQQQAA
jgi:hypothetical protein